MAGSRRKRYPSGKPMSEFAEKVAASDAAKKKAPAKKRARRSGVTPKPAASTEKVAASNAVRGSASKAKGGKLLRAGGRLLGRVTVPLTIASATYEGLKFLESNSKPVPTRNNNRVTATSARKKAAEVKASETTTAATRNENRVTATTARKKAAASQASNTTVAATPKPAAKKVAKPAAKKVAKPAAKKKPFHIRDTVRGKMAALERRRARTAAAKKK